MARIVKKEAYAARRNEILDATQRLVYLKGYEQMSVQDILDTLQISKGAFYHYFKSKGEALDSLVERMIVEEVMPLLQTVVQDPELSAVEKLHRFFDTAIQWKSGRKTLVLELVRVWLSDENAIVRQKLLNMAIEHITPLLTKIVRQGIQESVFTTDYPDQTCQVIYYTLLGLSNSILELLILDDADLDRAYIESTATAYVKALNDVVERLLGAKSGSLHLVDTETLEEWFPTQETIPDDSSDTNGARAIDLTIEQSLPMQARKDG